MKKKIFKVAIFSLIIVAGIMSFSLAPINSAVNSNSSSSLLLASPQTVNAYAYSESVLSEEFGYVQINSSLNTTHTDTAAVMSEDDISVLAIASTHSVFDGWYDDASKTTLISSELLYNFTMPENTVDVYAHFSRIEFELILTTLIDGEEGLDLPGSVNLTGEANADGYIINHYAPDLSITLYASANLNFEFVGFYLNDNLVSSQLAYTITTISADEKYYAVFNVLQVDVTFDSNGGDTLNQTLAINYNTAFNSDMPTLPLKEASVFVSWNTQADGLGDAFDKTTVVTEAVTVYAIYSSNVDSVDFIGNGGLPALNTVSVLHNGDLNIYLPVPPTYEAYTFAGWNTLSDGLGIVIDENTVITGDLVVYAIWDIIVFEVTFESNGGVPLSQIIDVDYGTSMLLLMPTNIINDGYSLVEYNTDPDGLGLSFDANTIVMSDLTVYAIWEPIFNTITYKVQDANLNYIDYAVEDALFSLPYGSSAYLPLIPSRDGYTFLSWNTGADGLGLLFDDAYIVTVNQIVYAIWQINTYDITIYIYTDDILDNSGGLITINLIDSGTDTAEETMTYKEVVTLQALLNENFTFKGWFTGLEEEIPLILSDDFSFEMPDYDIVYYAKIATLNNLVVETENVDDANSKGYVTITDTETGLHIEGNVEIGTHVTLLAVPKDGYMFEGWYTSQTDGDLIDLSPTIYLTVENNDVLTYYARFVEEPNYLLIFLSVGFGILIVLIVLFLYIYKKQDEKFKVKITLAQQYMKADQRSYDSEGVRIGRKK